MKKKFLALGMTLLAGLTLASCGEDTKATTTETVVPTETTTDKPAETTPTAPVETYTYHEAVEPTYTSKGILAHYTKDG